MKTYDNTQRLGELLNAYKIKKKESEGYVPSTFFWDYLQEKTDKDFFNKVVSIKGEAEQYLKENKADISATKAQVTQLKGLIEDEILKMVEDDDRPIVEASVSLSQIGSVAYKRTREDILNLSKEDKDDMVAWAFNNGYLNLLTLNEEALIAMSNEMEQQGQPPIKGVTHQQKVDIKIR